MGSHRKMGRESLGCRCLILLQPWLGRWSYSPSSTAAALTDLGTLYRPLCFQPWRWPGLLTVASPWLLRHLWVVPVTLFYFPTGPSLNSLQETPVSMLAVSIESAWDKVQMAFWIKQSGSDLQGG